MLSTRNFFLPYLLLPSSCRSTHQLQLRHACSTPRLLLHPPLRPWTLLLRPPPQSSPWLLQVAAMLRRSHYHRPKVMLLQCVAIHSSPSGSSRIFDPPCLTNRRVGGGAVVASGDTTGAEVGDHPVMNVFCDCQRATTSPCMLNPASPAPSATAPIDSCSYVHPRTTVLPIALASCCNVTSGHYHRPNGAVAAMCCNPFFAF